MRFVVVLAASLVVAWYGYRVGVLVAPLPVLLVANGPSRDTVVEHLRGGFERAEASR